MDQIFILIQRDLVLERADVLAMERFTNLNYLSDEEIDERTRVRIDMEQGE